jgi:hypothetical protein
MKEVKYKWTGTCACLMHNARLANPMDEFVKQLKPLVSKKAKDKTDEDFAQIAWIEFQGGIYFDPEIGVYFPGQNILACVREAAKLTRNGETVRRGMIVVEDKVHLKGKYPKTLRAIFDAGFRDIRCVGARGSKGTKTMRCRPMFFPWEVVFSVYIDEDVIESGDRLLQFMEVAGRLTGLGDGRPYYGKFTAEVLNGK